MREYENEIKQAGGALAAIGLGHMNYARLFREETRINFPLLVDAERLAYKAAEVKSGNLFHIFRGDNSKARDRARASGYRQHQLGKNPFQLGASLVFGPGNRDLFVHFNRTFSDDADPKTLVSVVQAAGEERPD